MYQSFLEDPDNPFNIKFEEEILLGDEIFHWDIQTIGPNYFHILYKHQSFRLEVVEYDEATKTFTLKINGKTSPVQVKDKFDLLLEKLGMADLTSAVVNDVKAPMPGLILDILVEPSQEIKQGDVLIVLEAMKMENVIKAEADATVEEIKVNKGDSVEKNQILIQF